MFLDWVMGVHTPQNFLKARSFEFCRQGLILLSLLKRGRRPIRWIGKNYSCQGPSIQPQDELAFSTRTRTDTLCPFETRYMPKLSIKVDFPTPGGPERPMRKLFPSRND